MIKDKLIPFSKDHSISEVIFTLFLVQPLILPERYGKILETEGNTLSNYFQEFKKIVSQEFGFMFNQENTPVIDSKNNSKIVGFEFRKFSEGKLKKVFRLNNEPNPMLVIHDLEYTRWADFYTDIDLIFNGVNDFDQNIFVRGIGISYIDQFTWNDNVYPEIKSIFKENKYLPNLVFEARNNLNFSTNHNREVEKCIYAENISVNINQVSENSFNISLIHNAVENIELISLNDLLKGPLFKDLSTKIHNLNKDLLKDILKEDVLDIIHLK